MRDRQVTKNPTFVQSALIAARGCVTVFRKERKLRLALIVGLIFVTLAMWVDASYLEIFLIMFAWTQVMVGEILNTALEKAMDYASSKEFHPLIRRGKDYAAASVFLLSVFASLLSLAILVIRIR